MEVQHFLASLTKAALGGEELLRYSYCRDARSAKKEELVSLAQVSGSSVHT